MEVISDKPTRKFLSAITLWSVDGQGPVITRQRDTAWLVFIKLNLTDADSGPDLQWRTKEGGND